MTGKDIIEQILSKRIEISRSQILERLETERNRTGGLISDDTLLKMIAAELGLKPECPEEHESALTTGNLFPGLNNVTLAGRIVAIFQPKIFSGKKSGKLASVLIADRDGLLRAILWNDKATLLESGLIRPGRLIRFSHGYTKEGRHGNVELNVDEKCTVEVDPANVDGSSLPSIDRFLSPIREIAESPKGKRVNVSGVVTKSSSPSNFERKDGSNGVVMRLTLADKTGHIPVVLWNERVGELEKTLKDNCKLLIVSGRLRKDSSNIAEIHVDSDSYIEVSDPVENFTSIADLRENSKNVNVRGEIVTNPTVTEVKTLKGEKVRVANFELEDSSGKIRFSAWRSHADTAIKLKTGMKIAVRNANVRKGFGDQLEISTGISTSIVAQND